MNNMFYVFLAGVLVVPVAWLIVDLSDKALERHIKNYYPKD